MAWIVAYFRDKDEAERFAKPGDEVIEGEGHYEGYWLVQRHDYHDTEGMSDG